MKRVDEDGKRPQYFLLPRTGNLVSYKTRISTKNIIFSIF